MSNEELRHWDIAPDNAQRMWEKGISFALTTSDLDNKKSFRKNLLRSVDRGFSKDGALASVTVTPAKYLGLSEVLGTLEKGKIANLMVTNGDYFDQKTTIESVWIEGLEYLLRSTPDADARGTWLIQWSFGEEIRNDSLKITGEHEKPKGKLIAGGDATQK